MSAMRAFSPSWSPRSSTTTGGLPQSVAARHASVSSRTADRSAHENMYAPSRSGASVTAAVSSMTELGSDTVGIQVADLGRLHGAGENGHQPLDRPRSSVRRR